MLSGEELFVRCFFMGSPYTQRKVLTAQDRRVYRGICRRPSYQGSVAMSMKQVHKWVVVVILSPRQILPALQLLLNLIVHFIIGGRG